MPYEILHEIKKEFKISKDDIETQQAFYSETIKPRLQKKFLSHLISTLEDLINEKKKSEFIENIKRTKMRDEIDIDIVSSALNLKQLRLFTISLVQLPIVTPRAYTKIINGSAIIYFGTQSKKEQRLLIAHELGHVALKYLFPNSQNEERFASLFAFIVMEDKNRFYKEECKEFISQSDIQILNDIIHICDK